MKIDLEQKSKELKNIVAQFDTSLFLGDLSSMKQFISFDNPIDSLKGLTSPLRQLYYVAGLNATSNPNSGNNLRNKFSEEDWLQIKSLLIEIEEGYVQYFLPEESTEINEDWVKRRRVAMPSFLNFFNQAALNYEEQVIERIKLYFTPLEKEIINHFGLSIEDFISIYNYIDSVPNKYLEEKIHKKDDQPTWEEFAQSMIDQNVMPDKWQEHMPDHFTNFFNFMYDHGSMMRFTFEEVEEKFGTEKAKAFLDTFTISRKENDFLFYTDKNPLLSKPLYKVIENEYQCMEFKQVAHAIYDTLFEFCFINNKLKEKLLAIRGKKFEDKIIEVFQNFFNNKAIVHKGFYTQDGHEQDLLFLVDGAAFIVEAKSSKRKEPKRNPDRAYPFIIANFNETIQKGYDQAYRVKEKFLNKEILKIYKDQKLQNHIIDLKTKNYHSYFSIIVTQEVFGYIQIDLSELLEIWEDDTFPWSVGVDDLEVLFLFLKKSRKST
ncbi:hypothetical protein AAE02nite_43470 [Adhaeribacter aerolatus]|uniref:NERD domain-containing protein n=1 Tax=Adhaeribacter aerolatus TaxID=670289 RepID=A0A512B3Z0_9BACT|nr:hypothetical protein [Adhaeribacter aerolatus]GEO06683.1 hypothetical protein AAE02nite_43470 [Adhaeribacter aerolatus]